MRYIITSLLCVSSFYTNAQITFQYDQSIPVTVNGKTLKMPWVGGMNSSQYNTTDLNDDGVEDLVLFDRTSNKINTYLAEGNDYKYHPDYESYFPKGMTNWVIMRDYDCDGKKDIFTSSPLGITLYKNVSSGGQLAWEVSVNPITTLGFSSIINLKINGSDIPAIEDIDGDGDLDILSYGFNGGDIQFHQNFSMERTGSCVLPDYERVTTSWGNFSECECGSFSFNGGDCKTIGGRELHIGGKSLLVYDMDGDGDMEVVVGDEDCNTLYLLENKGSATNAIMDEFVLFPNGINPASLSTFPAAYLQDINFDGNRDLLVSQNLSANSFFTPIDFQNSSWVYNNTGNNNVPNFQFSSSNFLQTEMIDHGNNSSVIFADEEGDGDLDMLVTSHGQVQQLAEYNARIALYRNIGTKSSPEFSLETEDYLGLSVLQLGSMKLQMADINSDGNQDLIIAATWLNSFAHAPFYLLNNSASRLDFGDNPLQFFNIRILSNDNPHFFDVDLDGLTDLLLGKSNGNLSYFRNIGIAEAPIFELQTDSFYNLEISFTNRNLVPIVEDLDGDGNVELITTDGAGQLTIYQDFLNHLDNPLEGAINNYFNPLTEETSTFRLGAKTLPAVVDLYNSGTPVIVLGTAQGGLQILKNTDALPPKFENSDDLLSVFPNPGTINRNNGIIEITSKEALFISIVSVLGQEIYSSLSVTPINSLKLSIDTLPSGMYLVVGERNGKIVDQIKFIVVD